LALIACLILIADSLPLLFLGISAEEKSPILVFAFAMVSFTSSLKGSLITRPRHFIKSRDQDTVQDLINGTLGPAPWYWQTFPVIQETIINMSGLSR